MKNLKTSSKVAIIIILVMMCAILLSVIASSWFNFIIFLMPFMPAFLAIIKGVKTIKGEKMSMSVEPLYNQSEKNILKAIIEEELKKSNFDKKRTIHYIENRKFKLTIISSVLNVLFISFIFFHLPMWTYFLVILNIIVYIMFMRKYNIVSYLVKQIKARPDDNISDIVNTFIQSSIESKKLKNIVVILVSFALPILIYFEPRVFYENYEDGYYIRFYTVGITNFTKVDIPETYKGKKILGIRGNVFANMYWLEEIDLPDSIEMIRGEAFKNCKSLEYIDLPDNITEIKGSTFENCSSLKEIEIPDGVTRIGGSAFRNCTSLEKAFIPSSVKEIGSSAFRNTALTKVCYSRYTIVNQRAFKDNGVIKYYYQEDNCESEYSSYHE